jgi:formylglycine-generating enzyme required for sulfatase activity
MVGKPTLILGATLLGASLVVAAMFAPLDGPARRVDVIAAKPVLNDPLEVPPPPAETDGLSLIVVAPAVTPADMAWIPGGTFRMGSDPPGAENEDRIKHDEVPAHEVDLDGFWIDKAEVTNRQFAEFVKATGFVTASEIAPTKEELARAGADVTQLDESELKAGSVCFNKNFPRRALDLQAAGSPLWEYHVWEYVDGANWRHPDGPDSTIDDKLDHPVVHVSWEDAQAYCKWAGKQLPSEAQWEYAARGGEADQKFPWGDIREPGGKYCCNYWQGKFPSERLDLDGFTGTAPVKSFPANGYGLFDTAGNVWEWCADFYDDRYYEVSPRRNPPGSSRSHDSREPNIVKRSIRGGSFLCNVNSCTGYRCAARMGAEFNAGAFHTGFRCVVTPDGRKAYEQAQMRIAAELPK